MSNQITTVSVYCASSSQADEAYLVCARRLGALLAGSGITIVYGGGSVGLMGALADAALKRGGHVIGIIPEFMQDLEWGHGGVSELRVVPDMHTRKRLMMESADAVIALPGGCGTLEELLEAITWKRLGLFFSPIVMVNTRRFYDPLAGILENAINDRFMDPRHRSMWTIVDAPEDVLPAIELAPVWTPEARAFATL